MGSQAWGCYVLKLYVDINLGRTNHTGKSGMGLLCVEVSHGHYNWGCMVWLEGLGERMPGRHGRDNSATRCCVIWLEGLGKRMLGRHGRDDAAARCCRIWLEGRAMTPLRGVAWSSWKGLGNECLDDTGPTTPPRGVA